MALTFGPTPFTCRSLSGAPDAGAMTGSSTTDPGWTACSGARGGGGMFSASVASACGATGASSLLALPFSKKKIAAMTMSAMSKIGRAAWRERVGQEVEVSVGGGAVKKKKKKKRE